jgi:hypothetical protein
MGVVCCNSGDINTAVTKIGNFLHKFEAIFKKALTRVSGPRGICLMKKNQRSKISCKGPFKEHLQKKSFSRGIRHHMLKDSRCESGGVDTKGGHLVRYSCNPKVD